ncbi:MAG: hypothetical protein AB7J35_16095 [Dehalococcoidia bacterium]
MLPEYLPGETWLEIFELYGYSREPGADVEDAYLWCVGKNPGPPTGFWFAASEYAAIEVKLVVAFLVDAQGFDEHELLYCITVIFGRRNALAAD